MVMNLTDADRQKVSDAIGVAEANSNGEIVAVATPISDSYHDVALHWALIPLFAVLAWAALRPTALVWWYDLLAGGWSPDPTMSQLLTLVMVLAALKFTVSVPSTRESFTIETKLAVWVAPLALFAAKVTAVGPVKV